MVVKTANVVANNGISFTVTLSSPVPVRDEMTAAQFDQMMATGMAQAMAGDAVDADKVFDELERRLG